MELPRPEMDAKKGIRRHIKNCVFVSLSLFVKVYSCKASNFAGKLVCHVVNSNNAIDSLPTLQISQGII
jgi:hypothetical protein